MKNYNKELQHNKNINKGKYLLIGFIIGIIPFSFVLLISSIHEGGMNLIPSVFKNTIIIFGIMTSLLNGIILQRLYISKTKEFSK